MPIRCVIAPCSSVTILHARLAGVSLTNVAPTPWTRYPLWKEKRACCRATRPSPKARSTPARASSPAIRSRPLPKSPTNAPRACRSWAACTSRWRTKSASIAAVIGASLAGAKALTATSGPGFSLMQENLGLAVMGEVPCVVVNVQRSGPEHRPRDQAGAIRHHAGALGTPRRPVGHRPVPRHRARMLHADRAGFQFRRALSRPGDPDAGRNRRPHARERGAARSPAKSRSSSARRPAAAPAAYLPFKPDADGVAPLAAYGGEYVFHVTSSMHGTDGYSNNDPANAAWRVRQLHDKIERHRDEIVLTQSYYTDDMDVLIVALGRDDPRRTRGGARSARAGDQSRRAATADDLALPRQGNRRARQRTPGWWSCRR